MSIIQSLKDLRWVLKRKFIYGYQWRRVVRKYLAPYYRVDAPEAVSNERTVVCMADGKRRHGGLADRLRSYVTYYGFCKERGLRFAINFTSPFNLEDYLEPNQYDWRLKPGELTFNSNQARPLFFQTSGTITEFEKKEQLKLVERFLDDSSYRQFHMYSNYCFGEDNFGKYFNELFKPTARISDMVKSCKKELGEKYISVSTRFLELLGDFKEPKEKIHLNGEEQKNLISRCRAEVEKLHREFPECSVLLTSDSMNFINACRDLPYVYIPEGKIAHVDVVGENDHSKTFVDFLLIAGAEKVFQIKIGPMYSGNFSLRASQAGGKPYRLISLP